MKLNMLGTGHATVTKCYNTCFTLSDEGRYFLTDAGGGNGILRILEEENIPLPGIHDIFVSHGHTDHIMGVIWMIRMIGQLIHRDQYQGQLRIYCHEELSEDLVTICKITLGKKILKLFGGAVRFVVVGDGQEMEILHRQVRFFDLCSSKKRQFGYVIRMENGEKLSFCGDETLSGKAMSHAEGCDWLMHEAFCLYEERDLFHPYEKHHGTVKDACETAAQLKVKNLVLYHTEDTHIGERKKLYLREGKRYFDGNLFVPDDRDVIMIGNQDSGLSC